MTGGHSQKLNIVTDLFPFYLRGRKIKICGVHLFAFANDSMVSLPFFDVFLTPDGLAPNPTDDQLELNPHPTFDKTLHGMFLGVLVKKKVRRMDNQNFIRGFCAN